MERAKLLPILENLSANISSLMPRCTRECHHSFFRLKVVTLDAPTACLINIGGHRRRPCIRTLFVRQKVIGEPPKPTYNVTPKRAENRQTRCRGARFEFDRRRC